MYCGIFVTVFFFVLFLNKKKTFAVIIFTTVTRGEMLDIVVIMVSTVRLTKSFYTILFILPKCSVFDVR